MTANLTPEERVRLTGPIMFGHKLNPPRVAPVAPSLIHQIDQEELNIHVLIEEIRIQVRISNSMRVRDLLKKVAHTLGDTQEMPLVLFQGCAMLSNDLLVDRGIINGSIIHIERSAFLKIQISIKLTDVKERITHLFANRSFTGNQIKRIIHDQTDLDHSLMKLFHRGVQLRNQTSLADLGINSSSTLTLKVCKPKGFRSDSLILLADGSQVKISQIKKGYQIMSMNVSNTSAQRPFFKAKMIQSDSSLGCSKVVIEDNTEILFSQGFLFDEKGRWSGTDRLCLGKNADKVMTSTGKFVALQNIHHNYNISILAPSVPLTYLLLEKYHPYFVNGVLFSPVLDIQVLHRHHQRIQLFSFDMHAEMNILEIKKKLTSKLHKSLDKICLFIENMHEQSILMNETKISQIYHEDMVIQVTFNERQLRSTIQIEKVVHITFENVTIDVKYKQIAEKTCKEVIELKFAQKVKDFPYFGVLHRNKVVKLNAKIIDIINRNPEQFYYETFQLIVIKFPERFILGQLLKRLISHTKSNKQNPSFFESFIGFFKRNVGEPMLNNYKKNHFFFQTRQILNNLHLQNLSNKQKRQKYDYISEMINYLNHQQQHIGKCYRALKEHNLPGVLAQGNIIHIRQFLSCSTNQQLSCALLQRRGILFHITSISGKLLPISKNVKEVVFLPFTYFIIQKIIQKQDIIHVHMTEMPTSLDFSKDIILWVDDNPDNNIQTIHQFKQEGVEIIQLSSTAMARRWFEQFGWMVNRLNRKMRVVTDMVRDQPNRQGQIKQNFEAGIDLIEYLFNESGFTTPVLIFCRDCNKGRQNVQKRKIRPDRYHQVTNRQTILERYMNFEEKI